MLLFTLSHEGEFTIRNRFALYVRCKNLYTFKTENKYIPQFTFGGGGERLNLVMYDDVTMVMM